MGCFKNSVTVNNNGLCFVAVSTVKFHLKSLPPAASDDVIAGYFEFQGENVDILSIEKLQDDEAIISLSGLSEEGNSSHACT